MTAKGKIKTPCDIVWDGEFQGGQGLKLEHLVDRILAKGRIEDLEGLVDRIVRIRHLSKTQYSTFDLFVLELYSLRCEEYAAFETIAGVYLPSNTAKHRRFNDLFLERAAPGQALPDKDIMSLRQYKESPPPYAQGSEMQAAGLKPGQGGAQYTHVNTVDAPVDHICASGHQLLIGNKNAAAHYNMSPRGFERWSPPGVQVGHYMIYNVTSVDYHKKTEGEK